MPINPALAPARIGAPGRLTIIAGEPVHFPDSDNTSTTLRYVPMPGNDPRLFLLTSDGSWESIEVTSELSFPQTPPAASTMFSVFLYNNSGSVGLETVAWTNDTTKGASAEWTEVDGVRVKNTDNTRRLIGVARTTSTQNFCISGRMQGIWNADNKIPRRIIMHAPGGSHSYAVQNTWREYNNGASNPFDSTWGLSKVGMVCGERENFQVSISNACFSSSTEGGSVNLGWQYDTTGAAIDDLIYHLTDINEAQCLTVGHADTAIVGYKPAIIMERVGTSITGVYDHAFYTVHGHVWG